MNLRELIDAFRVEADDRAKPYFSSDQQVIDWLNEAEREACIRARLIHEVVEISVAAGDPGIVVDPLVIEIFHAQLVDSGGRITELWPTERMEMDRRRRGWRSETRCPDGYVHDDKSLVLNAIPDADYTLRIEVYRLPDMDMAEVTSAPEIAEIHHRQLVDWALYRAFSVPDADKFDSKRAGQAEARFERYFGKRPAARVRRRQHANRPHHNQPCW